MLQWGGLGILGIWVMSERRRERAVDMFPPSSVLIHFWTCNKTRLRQPAWLVQAHRWGCRKRRPHCWGSKHLFCPRREGEGRGEGKEQPVNEVIHFRNKTQEFNTIQYTGKPPLSKSHKTFPLPFVTVGHFPPLYTRNNKTFQWICNSLGKFYMFLIITLKHLFVPNVWVVWVIDKKAICFELTFARLQSLSLSSKITWKRLFFSSLIVSPATSVAEQLIKRLILFLLTRPSSFVQYSGYSDIKKVLSLDMHLVY